METWRRVFEGRPFVTRQWAEGPLLVERFGALELRFALQAGPGGLCFEQRGAALALGRWRLALPRPLWPRVEAFVSGELVPRVEVELRLPLLGTLCRYAGALDALEFPQ